MRVLILSLIFIYFFDISVLHAATSAKKVCVNAKGAILIRTKCRSGEKLLSTLTLNQTIASSQDAAGLAGPQGIAGIEGVAGPVGPSGPVGIQGGKGADGQLNLSACRVVDNGYDTNFSNPSNSILYAEVFCNPSTEFLLEEDSRVDTIFQESSGTRAALQGRFPYFQTINGDVKEYGVGVFANRFLTVGNGILELKVRAVCCPR